LDIGLLYSTVLDACPIVTDKLRFFSTKRRTEEDSFWDGFVTIHARKGISD
jgi:hypothetical protein